MIDRNQQTVRQLRASIREWCSDVDEMVMIIGHDKWLDIPVREFQRLQASDDPVAMVMMWDVMAPTRLEIVLLPECDDKARTK